MKNIIVHSVSFWTQRKGKTKAFLWAPSLNYEHVDRNTGIASLTHPIRHIKLIIIKNHKEVCLSINFSS